MFNLLLITRKKKTRAERREALRASYGDPDELFTCQGCGHELPITFVERTPQFCYLCDPNITVEELLQTTTQSNETV